MSEPCELCGEDIEDIYDESVYKQVKGWVHGKKKDSLTLREDTHKYAHEECIKKTKEGQAVDQPDLFGE